MRSKTVKTVLATKDDFVLFTIDNQMFVNPTLEVVSEVLDSLDTGFGKSFAILSRAENYVQTLRGLNGFHLEVRETTGPVFTQYRIGRFLDSNELVEPVRLQKSDDMISEGFSNELLGLKEVMQAFSDFLQSEPRSDRFSCRVMEF